MEFTIEAIIGAPATTIYDTWLDSEGHTEMTGSKAECSGQAGGLFTAWEGYISGQNVELVPDKLIRQLWRTIEFEDNQPDSEVEITLTPLDDRKTKITIRHSNLAEKDTNYKQGWKEFYFTPMQAYFS